MTRATSGGMLEEQTTPIGQWAASVVGQAKEQLAHFDADTITGAQAAELVALFTEGGNLFSSAMALAAARAARSEIHRTTGHRSSAEWLAEQSGGSRREAADTLELGAVLGDQPELDEALRSGALPISRAVLVAESVKLDPTAGPELVDVATTATRQGLRDACARAKARARSREQEQERAARIHAQRELSIWTDPTDGCVRLSASLDPLAGAQLEAALRARADRLFDAARRAGERERPQAYLADALVELVTNGGTAVAGTRRAHVHIRVDLDVLRQAQTALPTTSPNGICEIAGVGPVPIDVVNEVLGEAVTHLLVTDGVDVTTVCGVGRNVPSAVKEALIERDPTCVVPGCDASRQLEMDHWQVDFARGGLTTLANLARLCSAHHDMKSRGEFTLLGGPGRWEWVAMGHRPDGRGDPPPEPPPDPPHQSSQQSLLDAYLQGADGEDDPEYRFRDDI